MAVVTLSDLGSWSLVGADGGQVRAGLLLAVNRRDLSLGSGLSCNLWSRRALCRTGRDGPRTRSAEGEGRDGLIWLAVIALPNQVADLSDVGVSRAGDQGREGEAVDGLVLHPLAEGPCASG